MRKMHAKRTIVTMLLSLILIISVLPLGVSATAKELRVGSTVAFGSYEQDDITMNGSEPIEWYVLYTKDDTALLLSKYALFPGAYNDSGKASTWDKCTLRDWMNDIFYETAFSSTEQNVILDTILVGEENPVYGTSAGDETLDKVFILSISEAKKYLTDNRMLKGIPTEYAVTCGTRESDDGTCWYWLRNPGKTRANAAYVTTNVVISESGAPVNYNDSGIRPAIWVSISKLN